MKNNKNLTSRYSILAIVLIMALIVSGCETTGSTHDGIKGTPLKVEKPKARCNKPFSPNLKKYGRLSPKYKRRLTYDYVYAIRNKIVGHWTKPSTTVAQQQCKVKITQRGDGCVKHVHFQSCPNSAMKTTIFSAIRQSSPLPQPPHPEIFDSKIVLTFKTAKN